jgi:hypothetical protein
MRDQRHSLSHLTGVGGWQLRKIRVEKTRDRRIHEGSVAGTDSHALEPFLVLYAKLLTRLRQLLTNFANDRTQSVS